MPATDTEHFKKLLHSRNLKATSPRLNLLGTMEKYKNAIPYNAIQEAMQPIDRVTLYRTLETLLNEGIIHKAFQESNTIYYAICGSQCSKHQHHHDHIHFKCLKCDTVTCEHLDSAVTISIPGYEIDHVSINIKGTCKRCKN